MNNNNNNNYNNYNNNNNNINFKEENETSFFGKSSKGLNINENLDYIIQPQLQQYYHDQYLIKKQQNEQQQQKQQQQQQYYKNNQQLQQLKNQQQQQQQNHHLINILDPYQKDKIVLKKGKDGLFTTSEDGNQIIPQSIIPISRFYQILNEINHFYEKEFFIYNRLLKLTFFLTLISLIISIIMFNLIENDNSENGGSGGKHKKSKEINVKFLLTMSLTIIFLLFYTIVSYIRYYSCPNNMQEYCNAISKRFSNITFTYYKGECGSFEKIKIEYPFIHISAVHYIFVNENSIDNNNNNNNSSINNINNDNNNSISTSQYIQNQLEQKNHQKSVDQLFSKEIGIFF